MPAALIVDDNPNMIRATVRQLRRFGWVTLSAPDARQAEALQDKVDVILTDWHMPGGGGAQVLERALRPVVIYTGTPGDVPEDVETPVLEKSIATAEEIDGALRRAIADNTNRRRR